MSESEKRMELCKACDNFQQTIKICKQCGCFMPIKVKLIKSECPIGKWHSLEPKESND